MNEEKVAILISFGALSIAVFSLGWNFYRDVLLKPRVRATIMISNIHHGDSIHGPYITIKVTNLGPGLIICESIEMMKKSILSFLGRPVLKIFNQQTKYAMVVHDYTNPYSSRLPKELKVGERLTLLLEMNQDSLLAVDPTHVGVADSFGRFHWAKRRSLKKAKQKYFEEYEKKPWGS